jgi:FtsH-binding integral membrane protein
MLFFSRLKIMKISKTVFFVFFVTLISVSSVIAGTNTPPKPMAKATAAPKPPDVPIDQSLLLLVMAALLFGTYTLYQYNLKRKASV